ncbi:Glycosyltransferase involved in cell wall bisynthesis [Verrucomicrobium sp. GAS474]|uniref:glycosyltransferase family 2 protein n=1 Tax=Verrucomicrobium sp. GAS474 TaxID=1882831 RepID=UPI00087AEBF4|nr:glycosyltransferase family 2 protein [Verrucomicrobium sp. GAS474]SDU05203.1 Glycosyltransferase involved in cell wall bisynthesis [Verrucomicrobium sp. GAS474]
MTCPPTPPPDSDFDTSKTGLILLPSYNSGRKLLSTVEAALAVWKPVWVVVDASTDGSEAPLLEWAAKEPALRVFVRGVNGGKGAAVLDGLREAGKEGFRHALVMDADGQHPADRIVEFMNLAHAHERTLILGVPAFGPDAPKARVYGRLGGNTFTEIATLWGGIRDSLFGFRVYPVAETVAVMDRIKTARRYDFDTEVAVRLYWEGFRTINIAVPVLYPSREEGGVSYFHYLRDNLLLVRTHARLFFGMLRRFPRLLKWRLFRPNPVPAPPSA